MVVVQWAAGSAVVAAMEAVVRAAALMEAVPTEGSAAAATPAAAQTVALAAAVWAMATVVWVAVKLEEAQVQVEAQAAPMAAMRAAIAAAAVRWTGRTVVAAAAAAAARSHPQGLVAVVEVAGAEVVQRVAGSAVGGALGAVVRAAAQTGAVPMEETEMEATRAAAVVVGCLRAVVCVEVHMVVAITVALWTGWLAVSQVVAALAKAKVAARSVPSMAVAAAEVVGVRTSRREERPAVGAMEEEVQVAVEMATAATAAPTVEEAGTQACPLEPWEERPAVGAMEAEVQAAVEMATAASAAVGAMEEEVQVAVEMATAAPTVVVTVEGLAEVVGAAHAQLPCTAPKL